MPAAAKNYFEPDCASHLGVLRSRVQTPRSPCDESRVTTHVSHVSDSVYDLSKFFFSRLAAPTTTAANLGSKEPPKGCCCFDAAAA